MYDMYLSLLMVKMKKTIFDDDMYLVSVDGVGDSGEENKEEKAALQVHPARSHPET